MPYRDRLQPTIVLTSPSGIEFVAKWVGNPRTQEKELGVFKTPGVKGVKIQDLEMTAMTYPLTIYFDGPDNDINAEKFIIACTEKGEWTVIHPVKGEKRLQLVSVTEHIQPVTSGNITQITTEWLEITGDNVLISTSQLSAKAKAQDIVLQSSAADQLENVVNLDTADKVGKFKTAVGNSVTSFNNTLESITATVAPVQAQADSIKRGIDATLEGIPIDVLSVAGQIKALIGLPNLVVTDLSSKLDTYSRFAESVFDWSVESDSLANINTVAVQELSLTAALGAFGVASVTTELMSRQSVIDSIESNSTLFFSITNGLDETQEIYADKLLIRSYFSQSISFHDAAKMVGITLSYLIKSVFDLAVEKRFVLTRPENPVMIAMREYKGPGDNDENIDLFYESNKLTGQESFLLPAGKEVVVYL